jgi:hypothetical protein
VIPSANVQDKMKLNWRALRLAAKTDLGKFGLMDTKRDIREPDRPGAAAEKERKAKLSKKMALAKAAKKEIDEDGKDSVEGDDVKMSEAVEDVEPVEVTG